MAIQSLTDDDTVIIEHLINRGCPANLPVGLPPYCTTYPLVLSVKKNLIRTVKCLLKNGAIVDKTVAKALGKSLNESLIEVLSEFNIDVHIENGTILEVRKDNCRKQ